MSIRDPEQIREDFILFGKAIGLGSVGLMFYIITTGFILAPLIWSLSLTIMYPITVTLITFILTVSIFYRTKTGENWQHRYLPLLSLGFFGFNFFQIFNWDIAYDHTPFQRPEGVPLLYLADMFIPLITIFLYLHFASTHREVHHPSMIIILGLLVFPYFPISLLAILGNPTAVVVLSDLLVFLALAALIVSMYAIKMVFDLFLLAKHERSKKSSLTTMVGLLYMVFAFVSQILTSDSINFGLFEADIFQLLLLSLAVILLLIPYIIDPTFVNATTSHVYEMLLYNDQRKVIWAYDFDMTSEMDMDLTAAKTQVITTVTTLLEEMSGFVGEIYRMDFSLKNSLFIYSHLNSHLVVMVHRPSIQHKLIIHQFFKEICRLLQHDDRLETSKLNQLVQIYYPQYF